MEYRKLGHTDLYLSEIGMGTNQIGGHNLYDDVDEVENIAAVQQAVEVGINFFDTADVYGLGRSEELLGLALGGYKYDVSIATKGGNVFTPDGQRWGVDNSPVYLRQALEASLRRLNREYLDLYYIHRWDGKTPIAEAFGALLRFKEEGKIRAAGVSNFGLEQLQQAMSAGQVDALQNRYNLFDRYVEGDLLEYCRAHGVGFVPYGPLAFGILGGRYERDLRLSPNDWRRGVPLFSPEHFPRVMDIVEQLQEFAAARRVPLAHLAMRWVLRDPAVTSSITGARRPAQVSENARAVGWDLAPEELSAIDRLTRRLNFFSV